MRHALSPPWQLPAGDRRNLHIGRVVPPAALRSHTPFVHAFDFLPTCSNPNGVFECATLWRLQRRYRCSACHPRRSRPGGRQAASFGGCAAGFHRAGGLRPSEPAARIQHRCQRLRLRPVAARGGRRAPAAAAVAANSASALPSLPQRRRRGRRASLPHLLVRGPRWLHQPMRGLSHHVGETLPPKNPGTSQLPAGLFQFRRSQKVHQAKAIYPALRTCVPGAEPIPAPY